MKTLICSTMLALTLGAIAAPAHLAAQPRKVLPPAGAKGELAPARRTCSAPLPGYANATTTCNADTMSITCAANFHDVNGVILDGCEVRGDGLPGSYGAARPLGALPCGASITVSGNTAPVGSDDWVQVALAPGCPSVTLTLTSADVAYYDVVMGGTFPPATPANAKLTGAHTFKEPASRQIAVRIWAPAFATYTLTAAAR